MNGAAESTGKSARLMIPRVGALPPGPRGLPLLGNLLGMLRDPLGFLSRIGREHGDVVRFRLPGQHIYVLNHPELIESVLLAKGEGFIKDATTRVLSSLVGNGLLTSEGAYWRRQRKLAQPAFHTQRVASYAGAVVRHVERFAAGLSHGEVRDIHQDMMRVTLDIAAETLFGSDVGDAGRRISAAIEVLMNRFAGGGALIPHALPTPGNLRARRALRLIDEVVYGLISRGRRRGADGNDLLSVLIRATEEGEEPMSDLQLRDEVVTLLLAGHETTALTTSFALWLLGRHPDADDELHAEVTRVVGTRAAAWDDLPRLECADRVIRESMRLYPPAWAIGREATAPFRVGGFDVEPGTQLWMAQWVVHRDPRFYSDPEAFRPGRWTGEFARQLPRFAYFPFGGGRRVCIGNSFAMMEAALIAVTLSQHVRLVPLDAAPLRLAPSVTLRPKGGIRMRVERR